MSTPLTNAVDMHRIRTGGGRPSSTRSTRAASPTRTATASATCTGITSRVAYLASLGIDAVWLSPFYPSALADGGYDVDDYRDVDPQLGHAGRLRRDDRRAARRRAEADRRHRAQPHLQPARVVPGGAGRAAGFAPRATGTSSGTARARTAREPPSDWPSLFGGSAWERVAGRPVVPAPVRRGAARPELGQPRGARRLPDHAAVLGRPRRRRLPRRRRPPAGQGPTEPLPGPEPTLDLARRCRTAATRSRTATRCTRSTPNGGRCSTSTTRRAPRSPRPGCTPAGAPATPARRAWARRSTSTCCSPTSTPASFRRIITHNLADAAAVGRVVHLGVLQPRRRPARHPLRPAARPPSDGHQNGKPGCSPTAPPRSSTSSWAFAGPAPRPC